MTASRSEFKSWLTFGTRWEDCDVYGHVNNVKYYAYFDTVINEYLMRAGGLNPNADEVVGFVVESRCKFFAPIHFPESIEAGLSVVKLGNSSVRYRIGLFGIEENSARAVGEVVHVFVARAAARPTPIPVRIRTALALLQ
jgi:acyl-CoA thioester hydrolase